MSKRDRDREGSSSRTSRNNTNPTSPAHLEYYTLFQKSRWAMCFKSVSCPETLLFKRLSFADPLRISEQKAFIVILPAATDVSHTRFFNWEAQRNTIPWRRLRLHKPFRYPPLFASSVTSWVRVRARVALEKCVPLNYLACTWH